MKAWLLTLLLAAIIGLFASPHSFRGGLLEGMPGAPWIAAGGLVLVAMLIRGPERRLNAQAGRLRGVWGCGTRVLQWAMVAMIAGIGLWLAWEGGKL